MKTKTNIKAGLMGANHNENLVRGLRVKTSVKAGGRESNHNETLVRGM